MATRNSPAFFGALVILIFCAAWNGYAQGRGGGAPGPPPTPKAAAIVDLTGYWVSLITEDWRYRMGPPRKGDYLGVPLSSDGRKAADAWDPAKDEAAGEQCKAYGAGAIMRAAGRLHITWLDDNTLKVEADAGTQTRMLNFRPPQGQGMDWQGVSVATWERPSSPMSIAPGGAAIGGSLKVVTTKMKPGYLRRNGVPYSTNAVITEYWDRLDVPGGDSLLVVSSEVVDPAYLATPFWTSTQFKKQNDGSGWNPTPCSAK